MTARAIAVCCAGLLLGAGCLSPEAIRRIEGSPGQEGTGITLSRLPAVIKIMATYPASEAQAATAAERGRAAQLALGDKAASRYLAVETEPDDRLQGAAAIMLWDTQTEEIIGNEVYDVEAPPPPGEVAMWDTISAQYVGIGRSGVN